MKGGYNGGDKSLKRAAGPKISILLIRLIQLAEEVFGHDIFSSISECFKIRVGVFFRVLGTGRSRDIA